MGKTMLLRNHSTSDRQRQTGRKYVKPGAWAPGKTNYPGWAACGEKQTTAVHGGEYKVGTSSLPFNCAI